MYFQFQRTITEKNICASAFLLPLCNLHVFMKKKSIHIYNIPIIYKIVFYLIFKQKYIKSVKKR